MAVTYLEISYPNFVLGAIIDPEEANQNNHDFQTKINALIEDHNLVEANVINLSTTKANVTYVDDKITNLSGSDRTTQTIKGNFDSIINHKISSDHDNRYYTKTELTPWLRSGDTIIREDVFTIINPNNGDGTFTYSIGGETIINQLGDNGEQIFSLVSGYYEPNNNRIEAMINDTLRRSSKSGGLLEIDNNNISLTQPEGSGTEITFKYYEKIGIASEYNIKKSTSKPLASEGKTMWFEVIG